MTCRRDELPFFRISLRQSAVLLTCFCLVLGFHDLAPTLVVIIAPGLFGPLVAYGLCPSRGALLAGLLAAYFCASLTAFFALTVGVGMIGIASNGPLLGTETLQHTALSSVICGGMLGGLLGARIERVGLVQQAIRLEKLPTEDDQPQSSNPDFAESSPASR